MEEKVIAWNKGSGNITLRYEGSGTSDITIESDANDLTEEREQTVVISSVEFPSLSVNLLVRQNGLVPPSVGDIFNFEFTGTVQKITLPAGRYFLQCWGAQGGSVEDTEYDLGTVEGSLGGYSEGVITLDKTTTLYIFVGGQGAASGYGGWNCGGGSTGYLYKEIDSNPCLSLFGCGGGATDICTVTSDMEYDEYYSNDRLWESHMSVFICAGGGGGACIKAKGEYVTEEVYERHGAYFSEETGNTTKSRAIKDFCNKQYSWNTAYSSIINGMAGYRYTVEEGKIIIYNNKTYSVSEYDGSYLDSDVSLTWVVEYYTETTYTVYFSYHIATFFNFETVRSEGKEYGGGTGGGNRGNYWCYGNSALGEDYAFSDGAGGAGLFEGASAGIMSDSLTDVANGGGKGFVNIDKYADKIPSSIADEYNALTLENGVTYNGNVEFESVDGGTEIGHSGNGYARITVVDDTFEYNPPVVLTSAWLTKSGTWAEESYDSAVDGLKFSVSIRTGNTQPKIRCTFSGVKSITFSYTFSTSYTSYVSFYIGKIDTEVSTTNYKVKASTGTTTITFTPSDDREHYVEFLGDITSRLLSGSASIYIKSIE